MRRAGHLTLGFALSVVACGVDQDLGDRPRGDASTDAILGDASADSGDASDAATDGGVVAKSARVAAGNAHTCAIVAGGKVKCWGRNVGGQLGVGDTTDRGKAPGQMGANLPFTDLGPGAVATALGAGFGHTCALLDDGRVKCWGSNGFGQLGLDDTQNRGPTPATMGAALPAVALGASAKALSVGAYHACVILIDGRVKCWGLNTYGQLGVGDKKDRGNGALAMASLPFVDLGAGRTARAIVAGTQTSCAILDDDTLKCWGFNFDGELGIGTADDRGDAPGEMGDQLPRVDLGAGRTVKSVAIGGLHTCALLDDGRVKCWGQGSSGALGYGDPDPRGAKPSDMGAALPAVDLGPGRTARLVSATSGSSCAILDDASVKCWGRNDRGQLGQGDAASRGTGNGEMGAALLPIALAPGRTAVALAPAEESHLCAILDDGALQCWGANEAGQLGLGDTNDRGDGPNEMGAALPFVSLGP
jgi:alpha-tubulin suppressor-like RCC1 family protein